MEYTPLKYQFDNQAFQQEYLLHKFLPYQVYDNLKYVLDIRKTEKNSIEEKINKAIMDLRLESIASQKVYKLSLYEKYLASIARLTFRKLDVVLIDNIFEELTPQETKELLKLFKKHFINKNTAIIIATSDENIAKSIATRTLFLEYGAISKEIKD